MLLEHLGKVVKKDRREKLVAHVFAYNELANCKVFLCLGFTKIHTGFLQLASYTSSAAHCPTVWVYLHVFVCVFDKHLHKPTVSPLSARYECVDIMPL